MDSVNSSRNDEVLLVEKISRRIKIGDIVFTIEEPSRKRLMEFLSLMQAVALENSEKVRPVLELQAKLSKIVESNSMGETTPEQMTELAKELEKLSMEVTSHTVSSDDKIIKFILGENATDEMIEMLGISQKKQIVSIAESVYGIDELVKNGPADFLMKGVVPGQ